MHRWLLSGLTCAAAVLLYAPYTYVHAQELPVRPGLIAAQLDSNKAVYHVGEPIMLRLTLINRTSQKIDFAHGAPYYMSDLEVVDTEGKVVSATIGRVHAGAKAPYPRSVWIAAGRLSWSTTIPALPNGRALAMRSGRYEHGRTLRIGGTFSNNQGRTR